jgi:CRISPR-associated protein Csd1
MLLQRLVGYSQRISLPPCLYAETPVDWLIDLDANGAPRGMVDLRQGSGKQKRGQLHPAPTLGNLRTSAIMPLPFCDNGGYVLGRAAKGKKSERVQQQHDAFKQLVAECHQQLQLPETRAVHEFYQHHFAKLQVPDDYDPAETVAFRVNGQWVIDLPAVQQFWAEYAKSNYNLLGAPMECLVCGQVKPALRAHYLPIKGIPGGQSSGMALVSINSNAFESYRLTEAFVSPICLDCSERALKALDALMRDPNTSLRVGKLVYCFWTRQPTQFSVVRLLNAPDPNEVKQLLQSVVQGGTPSQPQAHDFYAVALSANSARVVVRSYLETTLPAVQCNLAQWFRWQQLYAGDTPVGVFHLARALYFKADDIPAHVPETLIRCAITGAPLPMSLLQLAIQRNRAEQGVTDNRARLIQAVLYSHNYIQEVNESMQYPTETQSHCAYKCGRLLAVIERIQSAAIGNPNATLTDRYYGSASTAPASVFGVLLRMTQPHLSKLRKQNQGQAIALERALQDAMPDQFPTTLSLTEQGLFALGYYHQRREFFTPRNTAANLTADEQPTLMPEEVDNDAND